MNISSVTMAADSTQVVEPRKHETPSQIRASKRKKMLERRRAKKIKRNQSGKNTKRASRRDSDSDCDSDLDLRRELKPIGQYVHDHEDMLDHMFRSISKKKLKALMPECIKELGIEEIKGLCLEQLDMMSRKRILTILDAFFVYKLVVSLKEKERMREEKKKQKLARREKEKAVKIKKK